MNTVHWDFLPLMQFLKLQIKIEFRVTIKLPQHVETITLSSQQQCLLHLIVPSLIILPFRLLQQWTFFFSLSQKNVSTLSRNRL